MLQNRDYKRAIKYFFFLITFVLITNMAACSNAGEIQNLSNGYPKPPLELLIFSNDGTKRLSHRATQLEYQDWLANVDLANVQFSLDNTFISSFTLNDKESYGMSLMLNTSASRNIIVFLNPNSEVDSTLNGEYSLGCMVDNEKAFLIVIQGKRIAGGTLRCPTAMVYTHPQIFTVSQHGKVLLEMNMTNASEFNQIVSCLELANSSTK